MGTTVLIDGLGLRSLPAAIPAAAGTREIQVVGTTVGLADQAGQFSRLRGGPVFDVTDGKYGARGNGIADDTAAFQACIADAYANAVQTQYGIYVPQGRFTVTNKLRLPGAPVFTGDGPGASWIEGINVPGFVFEDAANGDPDYSGQPTSLIGLRVSNSGVNRGGIWRVALNKINCVVDNCFFTADGDLITTLEAGGGPGGVFSFTISNSKLLAASSYSIDNGKAGLRMNVSGFVALRVDIQGCGYAYYLGGLSAAIHGCRSETNDTVFHFGILPDGTVNGLGNFQVDSCQLEANNITFHLRAANNGTISNMTGGTWGETSPPIAPRYGILAETITRVAFKNVTPGGDFSEAAIRINTGDHVTFENVFASNNTATAAKWDIQTTDQSTFRFVNTNYPTPSKAGVIPDVNPAAMSLGGLAHADALRTIPQPKNLAGTVSVGAAATFVDVLFPAALDPTGVIHGLAAAGGGTVPTGSYIYGIALLNQLGLSKAFSQVGFTDITLSGGNHTVTMGVSDPGGDHSTYTMRIYRKASGAADWDGYFNISPGTLTFTDSGQAFDGFEQDGTAGTTPSGQEADANFWPLVTTTWLTTWSITNRATTGFRINFGSAPGGAGLPAAWLLFR